MATEQEIKKLEFLAEKSRRILEDQVDSYTDNHNKAGRIISVNSLFISFFLFLLKGSETDICIAYLSIVPFLLLFIAIFIFLKIFASRVIYQGFNEDELDGLYKGEYDKMLIFEVRSNKTSIKENETTVDKQSKRLNLGIILTYVAGALFTVLIILAQIQLI